MDSARWSRLATCRSTLAAVGLMLCASPARAHSPHDVLNRLDVTRDPSAPIAILAAAQLTDHSLIVRSLDGGETWTVHALPVKERGVMGIRFSPDFTSDGTAFIATLDRGLLKTVDRGDTWQPLTGGGLPDQLVSLALATDFATSGTLVCGTVFGVYVSADEGASWTLGGAGLTESRLFVLDSTRLAGQEVVFGGGKVFARSDDRGASWTPLHAFAQNIRSLAVSPHFEQDQTLLLSLATSGVFVSTNGGVTWQAMTLGLTETAVRDVSIADDGTFFAVTREHGLHRAGGPLQTWSKVVAPGFEVLSELTTEHYRSVAAGPDFASSGKLVLGAFEGLYLSDDGGLSFRQGDVYSQRLIRRISFAPEFDGDGTFYAVNYGGGLYRWTSPLPQLPFGEPLPGASVSPSSFVVGAGAVQGARPSGGPLSQGKAPPPVGWKPLARGVSALFGQELVLSPDFASDHTMYYAQVGMWRSTDRGETWQALSIPPTVQVVRAMALSPDYAQDRLALFGAGLGESIFRSEDACDTWTPSSAGLPNGAIASEIRFSPGFPRDDEVFLATKTHGVFRSTDGGHSWSGCGAGLGNDVVRSFVLSPDYENDRTLYAGTVGDGLFRSTDGAATWHAINAGLGAWPEKAIESLALSPTFAQDDTLYAATLAEGLFVSTDRGDSWQPVGAGLPFEPARVVALSPAFASDRVIVVASFGWIYRSSDAGATWQRLPGYNRFDDLDHIMVEEGAWTSLPHLTAHGEGFTATSQAGARVTFHFTGSSLRWFSLRGPARGLAEVSLDGEPPVLVDLYAPEAGSSEAVFTRVFDEVGFHVVRVTVTGLCHPLSLGTEVATDGFSVTF